MQVETEKKGDNVHVKVRRALDTGDADDYVIPLDTEVKMMWAVHSASADINDYHSDYGPINGVFKSDGTEGMPEYLTSAFGLTAQVMSIATIFAMIAF